MSEEAHPNLHAVGLTVDIIDAIHQRMRGNAANKPMPSDLYERVQAFVLDIDRSLDAFYGEPK